MARVPLARNLVQQQPVTDAKFRAFDSGAGAIGEGVRDFGRSMGQASEQWQQAEDIHNEAGAKKQINIASERVRDRLLTGDNAYYRQEGFNAVGARPQIDKFFTDLKEELGSQTTSPHMRQMFDDAFDRLHGQEADGVARYALSQGRAEETKQSAARKVNFKNDAIRFYDDPDKFDQNLQGGLIELRNQASKNGWAPETLKAEEADFVSGTHAAVIHGQMTSDIDRADAYLQKHRGEMTWKDAQDADAALAKPRAERLAYKRADAVMGLASLPSAPGDTGETVSRGQSFEALVKIEGGTDRHGKFLTSPKGAIGPAQVMPGTAPEAAKLAGLPWDDRRYRTDAAYNLALGAAYHKKLLEDFGDPVMAAAAYNAGGGRVRSALAQAKKEGRPGAWADYLPAETRNYIKKFGTLTNDPAVRQTPERQDLNEMLARTDVVAEREGWTFEDREAVKTQIEQRVSRNDKLAERQERAADDAAEELVLAKRDGFTSTAQIPRGTWNSMSVGKRTALEKVAEANSKPKEPPANSLAMWEAHAVLYAKPEKFRDMDLTPLIGKVTRAEMDSLISEQAKLRKPAKPGADVSPRGAVTSNITYHTMRDAALNTALDPKEKPEAYARVSQDMEAYVRSLTGGKRAPTDAELDTAFKRATMSVIVKGAGWFGADKEKARFELEGGEAYSVAEIPPAVRSRIEASLTKNFGRYSDTDVARLYVAQKGKPGFW